MRFKHWIGLILFQWALTASGQTPPVWDLSPEQLARPTAATTHLITVDGGRQSLVLDHPLKLEMYGLQEKLSEGWWRVIFKFTPDRAAKADEGLKFAFWNPNTSPGAFRFATVIAPFELGAIGQTVTIVRQMRIGPPNSNLGMALSGGWPGLRLDGIRFEPLQDPLFLTAVSADRLVYRPREAGTVTVSFQNGAAKPQPARLLVTVESGFAEPVVLFDADIDIPAGPDAHHVAVKLPPQPEYGHQLRAVLRSPGPNGAVLGEARDWYYVTDHPVRIGHLAAWGSEKDYEPKNVQEFVDKMRRCYFPMAELTFWAPDDYMMLVPPDGKDRWWSGQTLAQLSTATITARIQAAHAQGMKVVSYTDLRLDFGFRVSELFRQHPDWCNWDANDTTIGWSPNEINGQLREDDAERFDPKTGKPRFGARGVWGPQTGTPEPVDYHIAQLVASAKKFGFDGFRYDDPYDYDFGGADMLGNRVPYGGMSAPVMIDRLRAALRQANPDMIYGHNLEWSGPGSGNFEDPMPLDTPPPPHDTYTEMVRDDGLHLQERVTAYWGNGANWEMIADRLLKLGNNAARRGGHAYAITSGHSWAMDGRTLASLMMASRVHLAYWASEWQIPYLRLATGHCDLLYGDSLRPAPEGTLSVAVTGGREPWWKRYVRVLEPAPGHRIYLVHLINPPAKPGVDSRNQLPPPALGDLALHWTLPAGWKAVHAWQLNADAGEGLETTISIDGRCETTTVTPGTWPGRSSLPMTPDGAAIVVKPVNVVQWSIVAVECSGPSDDRLPAWRFPLPPVQPQPVAFNPEPVAEGYTPNGFSPRFFDAGHPLWKKQAQRVADSSCANGQAVNVQRPLAAEAYFNGIGGGRYRFSLRVKSSVVPPPNANLHLHCWPGGHAWDLSQDFPLTEIQPGAWTELVVEADMGSDHGNCGVQIDGGWDGLLIDRLEIQQIKGLTEAEQIVAQQLRPWPADLAPDPTGGAFCMLGLWHETLHLPEALKAAGVAMTACDWYVFRERRGWNGPPLNSPADLAKYRLVVLANVDARTLSVEQRGWLKGWVEAGGSLLMTGGPYGFGRGWWHESDLMSSLLPATLKPFDLRPVGADAPLPLQGAGPLADLSLGSATTIWLHELTPKPGAQVALTAGGRPALILGEAGKGRVALLALAPLGDDVPGAWWQGDAGGKITTAICHWLLR